MNASVCASTNLHAEIKLLREIISTINTIAIAMIAWNKSEYLFKKSILR